MSSIARALLAIDAVAFVGFGLAFVIAPGALLAPLGVDLTDSLAEAEIRTVYGGLEIGVGLFLATRLRGPIRDGILLAAMALGGLFLVRMAGMLAAGAHSRLMVALAAVEGLGLVANILVYRLSKSPQTPRP